jgi:hypothetical protein
MSNFRLYAVLALVWSLGHFARAQTQHCLPGTLRFGDFDDRGDVALFDAEVLVDCLAGPNLRPNPTVPRESDDCLKVFNSNSDTSIDLEDVARFQRSFTGKCEGLGACPPGTHLEHRNGVVDVMNQDSSDEDTSDVSPPEPGEYRCVADESCEEVDCSRSGECQKIAGKAVCACQPGYAGASCDRCAVGYEQNREGECVLGDDCRERFCSGQGDCSQRGDELICVCDAGASGPQCQNGGGNPSILRAPTYIEISDTDRSLELGTLRQMCATVYGGGLIDTQLNWSIIGPGTLTFGPPGCRVYVPPPAGTFTDSQVVQIIVCSQSFPDQCATRYLTIDPPGAIASTGQAHHLLKPFDDNIKRFMRYRCIGGAVLGISVFGKPVYVRGYGNLAGAPTNDPAYLSACGDHFNVSNLLPGYPLPSPQEVQPNSPFRIGSNSKAVAAAILRKAVKAEITVTDTDDNVEAVRLCDGVVPNEIHDVICMGQPPPVPLFTQTGQSVNCNSSNPCPYGGDCVVLNENTGVGTCQNCPPGFAGQDCSRNTTFCDPSEADDRWEDVTLGHLLGHTSGLPRSGPDRDAVILPNLFRLRDLMVEGDWADQEDILTSEGGFPNGGFAAEFPNYDDAKDEIGEDAYFVPRPSNTEGMLTRMGACLLSTPGTVNLYSNSGYALLGIVAETITGDFFAGTTGKPNQHQGSLLENFNDNQLGLPIAGQGTVEGLYHAQSRFELRNTKEPVWRSWTTDNGGSYYKLVSDEKRMYCDWISNDCSFSAWINGTDRFDWAFDDQLTLRTYEGSSGTGPASTGSFAVEPEVYLRFMAKYWVGGSGSNPRYGETRCPGGDCIWTLSNSHTGALRGAYSDVKQLGGTVRTNADCSDDSDCPTYTACQGTGQDEVVQQFCLGGKCHKRNEFSSPPLDPVTGVITDDFANLVCRSCELPVGVDIFVAFNQWDDKKCYEASILDEDDEDYYTCSAAYDLVAAFLGDAACKIPWPPNSFVLWPPVFQSGGSSMSPGFVGGQ